MTDQELMQQALDALTAYDGTNGASQRKRVLTALRERLAQPEHHDPIGDAQDKLIAEQAARPCKVGGPCVPTQTGPCACKELPPPIGPVVEQPQMQPCAGRNCGSTNPNLHSAECFEDYDKATGADRNRTWTQSHWTEYERSIAAAEREAIAQSLDKQADLACDEIDRQWAQEMAAAVRARSNT